MSTTANLSAFLRDPNRIIDEMEQTGRDVVLTRRAAPALRLSHAAAAEAETQALGALSQLLAVAMDDATLERMVSRISVTFPWVALLPEKDRPGFVSEFLDTARACVSVGRFDRLTIALDAWKSTAEAYADPGLAADGSDLHRLDEAEGVANPRDAE